MEELLAFASEEFRLHLNHHGGVHEAAHVRSARRQMGLPEQDTSHEEIRPYELEYLWDAFLSLCNRRQFAGGPMGIHALAIRHEDMAAWARLNLTDLTPWDVKVIERLDELFLKAVADARSRRTQSQSR